MKKISKKLIVLLCCAVLLLSMTCVASADNAVVVGQKYAPVWTEEWAAGYPEGLWGPFYINKADNTLHTDLVHQLIGGLPSGEWSVPGNRYHTVWEGTNACAPGDAADVGWVLSIPESGQIQIVLKGYMEVPGHSPAHFGIYKNGFGNMIYPQNSTSEQVLSPETGDALDVNMTLNVKAGDKIYFRFHSPVEVACSPQFRVQDLGVTWLSLGENADTTDPEPTEPDAGGDVIIAEEDKSYYLTPKYQDVTVDEENNIVTLTKKLTLKEFKESFNVKLNHTFTVIDTVTTKEVTDDSTIMTGDMICRIFNQGTPIANIDINVTYDLDAPAAEPEGFPVLGYVGIGVGVLVIIAVVVIVLTKKKKKG